MYLDRRTSILPHNYRSIKTGIMKALERQGITKVSTDDMISEKGILHLIASRVLGKRD
jgi:hypothetical protein